MTTLSSLPEGPLPVPSPGDAPAQGRRPTMRDVAAMAGVSFKTVSRVVNDEPGVSPGVAARVRAAAAELGYRPNAAATALRRADGRTATFGVLLEDCGNPFFAAVLRGIERVARERGVAVFSSSTDLDLAREQDMSAAYAARQVDALIVAPTESAATHLRRAADEGVRVVLVDRPLSGLSAPVVLADNRAGARAGVEHLIAHGHTRIGYIGRDPSIFTSQERFAGFAEALVAAGIPLDPALVRRDGATRSSAHADIAALLDLASPPTALFTAQDIITMSAVGALQHRGLQDRVALVGFDDFELADLLDPGVTVVAQDPHRMGEIAAEIALYGAAHAAGSVAASGEGLPARDEARIVPTRLIVRGSGEITAPPAGG